MKRHIHPRMLRDRLPAVLTGLGFDSGHARDVDVEQGLVRIAITGMVLAYAIFLALTEPKVSTGLQLALVIAVAGFAVGLAILWRLRRSPVRNARLRLLGIAADMGLLTAGLGAGGEPGVPLIGVYLWVVVGNGFRFGPRYLLASYWASLVCFGLLLAFVPFWQSHRGIGVGFFIVLALIPMYVLVLLMRLTAQKDAAEQLSSAKSRFVANVSHELRTPLAGVFAVFDLMRTSNPTPRQRDLVTSLGGAINALKSSVDAILQMSKLEAGAEEAHPRPFNLREFLYRLSALARPQAAAKDLLWTLDIDPSVPALAVGDAAHLQSVIGNLINNAIKFTAKGSVQLRVAMAPGGSVRFEVIDTGIGISVEHQKGIFERFVQADASPTRVYGGTGLGTSIAHDLTRLMGGDIGVHSAPGCGSTFWVELPLPEPGNHAPRVDWGSRQTVWLIGDHLSARTELCDKVTSLGLACEVYAADAKVPIGASPLAAMLLMEVEAALDVAERFGHVPLLVVNGSLSAAGRAALYRARVAGLLPVDVDVAHLRLHLDAISALPNFGGDTAPFGAAPNCAPMRVLLADDNRSNRMLLARILGEAGHSVVLAGRGDEAFDLMIEGQVDMAILDLNMPEMSGPDAIKLVRAGEVGGTKRLPIMILSAEATNAARDESYDAGADEYLTKPVTASELLEAVARHADDGGAGVNVSAIAAAASSEGGASVSTVALNNHLRAPKIAPAMVDQERLTALRRIAGNDRGFLNQYINAAFDDIALALAETRTAFAIGDQKAVRDALHKIDGTAVSVGADALVAASKGMHNHISASPNDSDLAAALAELMSIATLTKSTLAAQVTETQSPDIGP